MDTLENRGVNVDQSELQELRDQCQSLRQLVSALLVLLLIVAGALDIYLWRQYRLAHAELQRRGPQIAQFVTDYNRVSAPAIADFVKRLNDFERTHQDFGPILIKYGLKATAPTNASPATATTGKP